VLEGGIEGHRRIAGQLPAIMAKAAILYDQNLKIAEAKN
jgi:hypothetical protein